MRAAASPLVNFLAFGSLAFGSLAFGTLAVLAGGCTPGIRGFRAEPNVICKGSQTTLTWSATGDVTLSAVPADASLGAVPATGSRAVTPAAATTYHLTSGRCRASPTTCGTNRPRRSRR